MKTLFAALLIIGIIFTPAYAGTCFLVGEQITGMNKICFYQCVSGQYAITVNSAQLCPLSIND